MPACKLTYFNVTGLGEPIRLLLSYGGTDFEDVRYSFEEWPQHKPRMPMEQLPILEIDGRVYHQSKAICRYLAKQLGLYGSSDLEALEIDISLDDFEDMRNYATEFFREDEPTYKARLRAVAMDKIPFYLSKFEQRVMDNGGFFVANKLSYIDIFFTTLIDAIGAVLERDFLPDYPSLKRLHDLVLAHPRFKDYLDRRPKTVF